jgi:hypothetical protein
MLRRSERVRVQPVRMGTPHLPDIAVPRRVSVLLNPDQSDARKWRLPQALPAGRLTKSMVVPVGGLDVGHGFVVHELVRAGDPITLYSTKKITMKEALKEKARGNRHLYHHKPRMFFLDSKPTSSRSKRWMARNHQVGGLINSSITPNAVFQTVGEYCVVVAHPHDIQPYTEVSIKYNP